jgi:hypothetical protein
MVLVDVLVDDDVDDVEDVDAVDEVVDVDEEGTNGEA